METLLTKEEKIKVAKLCKSNPYKSMSFLEEFCKELQMMSVRDFAKIAKPSERTIYNMVEDIENAKIEVLQICLEKFIPAKLNKQLLK